MERSASPATASMVGCGGRSASHLLCTVALFRCRALLISSAHAPFITHRAALAVLQTHPGMRASCLSTRTPPAQVLGACGEKDCQASNMGAETLGCYSRPDAGGDGVTGAAQDTQLAMAFSDATRFGCVLDRLSDAMSGGFFNVSLTGITDEKHRGDAYLGLANRMIDVASGRWRDRRMRARV